MIEEKIENLIAKRKLVNNSNSFKEISKTWSEIKSDHEKCQIELNSILSQLEKLNSSSDIYHDISPSFDFDQSFNEIKNLSEEIKKCSVSEFAEKIKKMTDLKNICLQYLSKEKSKIEEVK